MYHKLFTVSEMMRLQHPFIAELKRIVASKKATLGQVVPILGDIIRRPSKDLAHESQIRMRQKKLSETVDMIHAAHVFHRCVRDKITGPGTNDLNAKRLHQDDVMSLLVGDYLLAQSSVDLSDLKDPRTVGLVAKGLEDYTKGEFMKLKLIEDRSTDLDWSHSVIEKHAELTCGSLMSNACLSTALLAGYEDRNKSTPGKLGDILFDFGFHTGTAHRLLELLYHPSANSEEERLLMMKLDTSRFVDSVHKHVEKAVELINQLSINDRKAELLKILEEMKDECALSKSPVVN